MLVSESQLKRYTSFIRVRPVNRTKLHPCQSNPFALILMCIRSALVPMHHTTTSSLIILYLNIPVMILQTIRWYTLHSTCTFYFCELEHEYRLHDSYLFGMRLFRWHVGASVLYIQCDKGLKLGGAWMGFPRTTHGSNSQPATK